MSKIEWTDETLNVVTGCDRISPGCDHCYIERTIPFRVEGRHFDEHGKMGVRLHPGRLDEPLHWRKVRRCFVNSLADLFHVDVPDDFIARTLGRLAACERHTFQILTKRPQRMAKLLADPEFVRQVQKYWWSTWFMVLDSPDPLPTRRADDPSSRPLRIDNRRKRALVWGPARTPMPLSSSDLTWPPPNVWFGTSVESQRYADLRIPHLLATPAAVRFLSAEPLLGPIDLSAYLGLPGTPPHSEFVRGILDESWTPPLGWVIAGGESGPGARPCHPDWARDLRDQCVAAGVPYFWKQWGEWAPARADRATHVIEALGKCHPRFGEDLYGIAGRAAELIERVGKKAAGRALDGRIWDEYPA